MQTLQQLLSGELRGSKSLKLSCGLRTFPEEIFDLADTLELLDLSGNELSELPEQFGRFKKLKIAFFSNNRFTEFPSVLSQCPQLDMIGFKANQITHMAAGALPPLTRWLILTDNCLTHLPEDFGSYTRLQKCMLAGNRLKSLPETMASCVNLELLRISANELTELPHWLFKLPKLSWLAYSGNPCSVRVSSTTPQLDEITWQELKIEKQLGEGASGTIYKAQWLPTDMKGKEVAVKIFKGLVTSDGLPDDEMATCITAGTHTHLVKILGKISRHPSQLQGLVMELIPPTFKNLGLPPSFESCTRDNFTEGTVFGSSQVFRIASGIAAASGHLHQRGLMHGDLYAHNILIDKTCFPLMSDFGAATAYDTRAPYAAALQRIEVRAFGCLLDDLLSHMATDDLERASIQALLRIQQDCMLDEVLLRPDFETISQRIALAQQK